MRQTMMTENFNRILTTYEILQSWGNILEKHLYITRDDDILTNLKYDIQRFFAYVVTSDGKIDDWEVHYINDIIGENSYDAIYYYDLSKFFKIYGFVPSFVWINCKANYNCTTAINLYSLLIRDIGNDLLQHNGSEKRKKSYNNYLLMLDDRIAEYKNDRLAE